jgi:hypothetical protein
MRPSGLMPVVDMKKAARKLSSGFFEVKPAASPSIICASSYLNHSVPPTQAAFNSKKSQQKSQGQVLPSYFSTLFS